MSPWRFIVIVTLCSAVSLPCSLPAQEPTDSTADSATDSVTDSASAERSAAHIVGRIVDGETGSPVAGVEVRLQGVDRPAVVSAADGRFTLGNVPALIHQIEFSHVAYGTQSQLVNVPHGRTVVLEVKLRPSAIELEGITVQAELRNRALEERGYYRRATMGFGRFFDEDEVASAPLSGLLREVPRLRLARAGGGSFSYIPVFERGHRSCVPIILIDERPIRLRGWALEELVDVRNIAAMEVYQPNNTPGQFQRAMSDCGAIVIWTRWRHRG